MKRNERDELEILFQDGLTDIEVQPDDQLWSRILKALGDKRRKRFLLWIIPVGILLTAGALWYLQPAAENDISNDRAQERIEMEKQKDKQEEKKIAVMPLSQEKKNEPATTSDIENKTKINTYPQDQTSVTTSKEKTSETALSKKEIQRSLLPSFVQSENEGEVSEQEKQIAEISSGIKTLENEITLADSITKEEKSAADEKIKPVLKDSTAKKEEPLTVANTSTPPKPASNPIGISLVVNPFLQFSQISGSHDAANYRRKNDKNGKGISLGLRAEKKLTNSWSVYLGIERTSYTQDIAREKMELYTSFRDSVKAIRKTTLEVVYFTRYKTDSSSHLTYVRNSYQYLNIPLGIAYHYKVSEKISGTLSGGISYSVLTGASVNTNYDIHAGPVNDASAVRKNLVLLQAGIGLTYRPGQRFSYYLSPNVSYTNSSVIRSLPFTEKHILTGISFGTTFWLGK